MMVVSHDGKALNCKQKML